MAPRFTEEPVLLFDGACGTSIQELQLPASAWGANEGCNEFLNLSAPDAITALHASFLDAGAMALETNTFGANAVVLAEYGLTDRVEAINRAAVACARNAIGGREGKYVAGSLGPTTKLASLGQITVDRLHAAYAEQARALLAAGVDALIIETCQDLLQVKTALIACEETRAALGLDAPLIVSVTVETTGTMLAGSDIAAVVATLEPLPVFALGLNCATGPAEMASHLRYLSRTWPRRIACMPNAGLPEVAGGRTRYRLAPDEFAARVAAYVAEEGVSVVGGCCGTTPAHIRRLAAALANVSLHARSVTARPALASLFQAVELRQEIPPLLIGERANVNGSKQFRERLLADDYEGARKIAQDQEQAGAHCLDLCTAYAGRDEKRDYDVLVPMLAVGTKTPLMIDSTEVECIAAALERYPGRPIVNSINLEDGGARLAKVCALAKKHGAAVVALTIDERGMALGADEKVAVARRIRDLAVGTYGLREEDLLFDALTFTVGSGDASLKDAARHTLAAIARIRTEIPRAMTVLGVSNVSFGLPPAGRKVLNSVFLHEAVAAGLSAAIIDVAKIVPFHEIPAQERELSLDLLHNRTATALEDFIAHFKSARETAAAPSADVKAHEALVAQKVVRGEHDGLQDALAVLLARMPAAAIINQVLVPAMRHVGELFGRGEMLLPFVLKSAEIMKAAVASLEPHMPKEARQAGRCVLLATVQGDVHDIGKNLVDIILSNNGYRVCNLGIKVPAETIIAKARELGADAIGLSGLLVKSALVMRENLSEFQSAGLRVPVLLGGAALTAKFTAEECVPRYGGTVTYCRDAFAGMKAMRDLEEGKLRSTVFTPADAPAIPPGAAAAAVEVARDNPVPAPPFLGARLSDRVDPAALFPLVNEQALFRGRWGFRRGKTTAEEYDALVRDTVLPAYERVKARAVDEGLLEPRVAYGYFRCRSAGERLLVEHGDTVEEFAFPRQREGAGLCIADYFKRAEEGSDIVGFFVATIGARLGEETRALYEAGKFQDYLLLHGFAVEVTDALAEHWHEVMRRELGIATPVARGVDGYITQEYQGSRYGFGYPACPDLEAHAPLFRLLDPARIGVTLTEQMQMVPEFSTSALVAHHPQAKYFAV